MILSIANRIVSGMVKRNIIKGNCANQYEYALVIRLSKGVIYGLMTLVALFLEGILGLLHLVVYIVCMVSLRRNAGGFHANSINICFLLSLSSYILCYICTSSAFIQIPYFLQYLLIIISSLVIIIMAPVCHINQEATRNDRFLLRRATLIVLFLQVSGYLILSILDLAHQIQLIGLYAIVVNAISIIVAKINNQEGYVNEHTEC